MSYFKIDEKNEIYYEYEPPKDNGYTCVFVNALTGDTSAWTGLIGENLKKDGNGYLSYNFRGQKDSKFDSNLDLDAELIVSDLFNRIGITLVDFKLEFGKTVDGKIVVADEISPDGCRLRNKETNMSMDKDLFRKGEGDIIGAYSEIMEKLIEIC